jgi:four helix bundle protein
MKTRSFEDLIVWQKSYQLVLEIYKLTRVFPKEELYGLTQQMRRAAISIPSNIAEGYGRQFNKEYRQFLSVAYGSLCELRTQVRLSLDIEYIKEADFVLSLAEEVSKMLFRMIHPER